MDDTAGKERGGEVRDFTVGLQERLGNEGELIGMMTQQLFVGGVGEGGASRTAPPLTPALSVSGEETQKYWLTFLLRTPQLACRYL